MEVPSIDSLIDDRPDEGVFNVNAKVFADPNVYELEQKYVFERTWIFLGLATQIPRKNDFITTYIGRHSVVVARGEDDQIHAFHNASRHKGALITRTESGNKKYLVCAYHGWAYDTTGKNVDIKDRSSGEYASEFDNLNHDLVSLARFGIYKGLMFASMSEDVPALEDFLGETRHLIDLAMDQGPEGMEFVPGRIVYTYEANWKLQMDNGNDFYHLTSTHPSLMAVVEQREKAKTGNTEARQFDWNKRFIQTGGMFSFEHGHTATWLNQGQPENRPIFASMDEVRRRVGDAKADWMLRMRNITLFPNMQIADSTALLIRTFRPLAVDRTEMRMWCLAPVGEDPSVRSWRMRQFEDFFNVCGMATPDDTAMYELMQRGFATEEIGWLQGYHRGMKVEIAGPSDAAKLLGMNPLTSIEAPYGVQNETCYRPTHREWARLMKKGIAGEANEPSKTKTNARGIK